MHQSEKSIPLSVNILNLNIAEAVPNPGDVEFIILPYFRTIEEISHKENTFAELNNFMRKTDQNATMAILTSPIFAAAYCAQLPHEVHLKLWISLKLQKPIVHKEYLTEQHSALLVFTRYTTSLKHTKTRIGYTYCPSCNKTTKDYGGKKHLYHEFGTLMSDVWRDLTVNFEGYPKDIVNRLADLFGIPDYVNLNVYDQRKFYQVKEKERLYLKYQLSESLYTENSLLRNGDCIEILKTIPENSIDFCFADPPYNLNKKYESWDDGQAIQDYFEWCDLWLAELARVLKPGRTLAVLNIPLWCIRHFKYLSTVLDYQDWIVWEGLSMPVRMIMPSHYTVLCFSKGKPRKLPGKVRNQNTELEEKAINGLKENYCLRPTCTTRRKILKVQDNEFVSNVWHDIHRLKHNSRRVDHPCQLPPMFMYRLISLFTYQGEVVLDPFNGAGTTTLAAEQLNRRYVGIELSKYYHNITEHRHLELSNGLDPFRKVNDMQPKAKNSPVVRLKKQKYAVSKKLLQLDVKNISSQIGHIPTKDEVRNLSKFPIEFFENYFINWGEVTAAARTTGMNEDKVNRGKTAHKVESQLKLFGNNKL